MSQENYITVDKNADQELAAKLLATSFAGTVLAGEPETNEEYASGFLVSEKSFSYDSNNLPEPGEAATDGASKVLAFDLDGCTVFLEKNEWADGLHIYPAGTSIKTLLKDFETGDLTMAEHLAIWGYNGTPEAAEEDATDVKIWCEPCFFAGTLGAPVGHYVYDESHDALVFSTVSDAQQWIDNEEGGVYVLRHSEAERPTYTICS